MEEAEAASVAVEVVALEASHRRVVTRKTQVVVKVKKVVIIERAEREANVDD